MREKSPKKVGGCYPLRNMGMGITAKIMDITPDLAGRMRRKLYKLQRNPTQATVDMFGRHQKDGTWIFNGDTIKFNTKNECIDGQQRLAACVASGVTITAFVVWGIPTEAYPTIDAGRARSPKDALRAAGIPNQTAVAAACQLLYRVENKYPIAQYGIHLKLSPMEIMEIARTHKGLDKCYMRSYYAGRVIHNSGVATACRWLFDRRNLQQSDVFFDKLASGANLSKGEPILTLRNMVMPQRLHVSHTMPLVVEAWNAFRRGDNGGTLRIVTGRVLPEIL